MNAETKKKISVLEERIADNDEKSTRHLERAEMCQMKIQKLNRRIEKLKAGK